MVVVIGVATERAVWGVDEGTTLAGTFVAEGACAAVGDVPERTAEFSVMMLIFLL